MITPNGHSKDPSIRPDGIVITWPLKMFPGIKDVESVTRLLHIALQDPESGWLQKCRNKPKFDILYVYIIIDGFVRYRLNYAGHESGPVTIQRLGGKIDHVDWPRIVLTAPIVPAPYEIKLKGFQGFRYCTELF